MAVLDNALQALFKMAHWEILWQNASPASSFPAQSVSARIGDYETIEYLYSEGGTLIYSSGEIPSGAKTKLQYNTSTMRERQITAVSTNSVTFGNAVNIGTYGESGATSNGHVIPLAIIGRKKKQEV